MGRKEGRQKTVWEGEVMGLKLGGWGLSLWPPLSNPTPPTTLLEDRGQFLLGPSN